MPECAEAKQTEMRIRSHIVARSPVCAAVTAKLPERALVASFLADVVGSYDVYGGNRDATLSNATHLPINDPMLLVPALAGVTEHLGFGFTCSII